MIRPFYFLTVLTCFATQLAFTQPICGFDASHEKQMKADPEYRKRVFESEARIQTIIKEQESRKSGARVSETLATLYTIPVVVHVMHTGGAVGTTYNPTDAQITGAISYLNSVYNGTYAGTSGVGDIQIQFALATRDTLCNTTTGIERINMSSNAAYVSNGVNVSGSSGVSELVVKNTSRWNPSSYYNIWVVNKIDGADGTSGQFVAGFAYLAGASSTLDGTIMLATQFITGQKTLPHEIGHALSLYHPFQGSSDVTVCPSNTDCTTDGDKVCDTDPISYNQSGGVVNFTPRSGTNTCTGTAYTASTENNYMNYTSVYNQFTSGQKTRMQAAMAMPSRASLASSWAQSSTYPSITLTTPASTCASTTSTGTTGNFAGLMSVTVDSRTFSSGNSYFDAGYVNETDNCTALIYLQPGGTYSISASVFGFYSEQVRAYIDYNNNGTYDSGEQIFYSGNMSTNSGSYPYPSSSGNFTVPVSATTGTTLRMRVINEVGTMYGFNISSGCYSPTYGQTEDYPVYIATSTLPVVLNYFKGDLFDNTIRLSWKTSSENNTETFDLERSYNGIDYTSISKTTASGNMIGSTYTYDDNTYTGTVMYYRLKQIDKSGSYKYSDVVTIKKESALERTVVIKNNPFREKFSIAITTPEPSKVLVNLTDVTGKLVYTKTINKLAGSVIVEPETSKLSAGVYMIQVNINGKIVSKKVIKQ
jgi:hypothetical protein